MLQVLQADWDPTFSAASYGFRPGRSAHQAVARAQEYIAAGHGWVVDLDLEKFFDRVDHDILMGLVAKRLEHIANSDPPAVRVISDNKHYPEYERTADEIHIVGRIRWFAREI